MLNFLVPLWHGTYSHTSDQHQQLIGVSHTNMHIQQSIRATQHPYTNIFWVASIPCDRMRSFVLIWSIPTRHTITDRSPWSHDRMHKRLPCCPTLWLPPPHRNRSIAHWTRCRVAPFRTLGQSPPNRQLRHHHNIDARSDWDRRKWACKKSRNVVCVWLLSVCLNKRSPCRARLTSPQRRRTPNDGAKII